MGGYIFQSDDRVAMIRAVGAVVPKSLKPQDACDQCLRHTAGSA